LDTNAVRDQLRIVGTKPILSWIDEDGYPASCRVTLGEDADGAIIIEEPPSVSFRAARASLLAHYHNERLWGIRAVLFRGTLAPDEGGRWLFTAVKQVGKANTGIREAMKLIGGAKKTAARYLAKRGLERPAIPWAAIKALRKEAKALGID